MITPLSCKDIGIGKFEFMQVLNTFKKLTLFYFEELSNVFLNLNYGIQFPSYIGIHYAR